MVYHGPMNFEHVNSLFERIRDPAGKYKKLIELGQALPPFPKELMIESHLVPGCQSRVYLVGTLDEEGRLSFRTWSDALISAGLAALIAHAYDGARPEQIIAHPPIFLRDLELLSSLSPSRSNGAANMYLHMVKIANNLKL